MNSPGAQNPTRTVPEPLIFSLLETARVLEQRLEEALARAGLSLAKFGVLSHLAESAEPLPLSELAEGRSCVRSNMTQLVDRLEADGLVRRIDDPLDRRVVRAELTGLGLKKQVEGAQQIEQVQAEFEASLLEADRKALKQALSALR
jgi:DNA-binding MarR family transcriptional regulator